MMGDEAVFTILEPKVCATRRSGGKGRACGSAEEDLPSLSTLQNHG